MLLLWGYLICVVLGLGFGISVSGVRFSGVLWVCDFRVFCGCAVPGCFVGVRFPGVWIFGVFRVCGFSVFLGFTAIS